MSKGEAWSTAAHFWCSINGWQLPKRLGLDRSAVNFDVAFAIVDALARDEGMNLWRWRLANGLDPVTGSRVSKPFSRRAPRMRVETADDE